MEQQISKCQMINGLHKYETYEEVQVYKNQCSSDRFCYFLLKRWNKERVLPVNITEKPVLLTIFLIVYKVSNCSCSHFKTFSSYSRLSYGHAINPMWTRVVVPLHTRQSLAAILCKSLFPSFYLFIYFKFGSLINRF